MIEGEIFPSGKRRRPDQRYLTITLCDSLMLLPGSLADITHSLGVTHEKESFDTLSVTYENYLDKIKDMESYLKTIVLV